MNFAVMVNYEDGKEFKLYKTLEDAQDVANKFACEGYSVTVFDCDKETGTYMEFYTI